VVLIVGAQLTACERENPQSRRTRPAVSCSGVVYSVDVREAPSRPSFAGKTRLKAHLTLLFRHCFPTAQKVCDLEKERKKRKKKKISSRQECADDLRPNNILF
jgi:hypothetical protein